MKKVYVTQEVMMRMPNNTLAPKFDLSDAERYGTLEVLFNSNVRADATVPVVRALRNSLRDFSDDDSLLLLGDPALMAIAAAIASERNGGRIKVLRWDRHENEYRGGYAQLQIDTSGKPL